MFAAFRNALDYPLRGLVQWQRAGLRMRNESKVGLFAGLAADDRAAAEKTEARLRQQYHLHALAEASSRANYRENLAYLELLERGFAAAGVRCGNPVRAADIGASHWFYVRALHGLLRWWRADGNCARAVELTGYETDAFRVYTDLHSRYDHACWHKRNLPGAEYAPQPFVAQPERYDVITMLFPFVFVRDHLAWGLPTSLFAPARLLAEAWDSLRAGGALLVVNQGEAEHAAQRRLLADAGIVPQAHFRHDSLLYTYDLPRYAIVCLKDC